jgi:hypothetical protein
MPVSSALDRRRVALCASCWMWSAIRWASEFMTSPCASPSPGVVSWLSAHTVPYRCPLARVTGTPIYEPMPAVAVIARPASSVSSGTAGTAFATRPASIRLL